PSAEVGTSHRRGIGAEVRVIPEIANVITCGNEVKMTPFPFPAQKRLVPGNRTWGQRQGAVVIISEEAVERSCARLRLPREEVVVTTREGELAPTIRRDLIYRRGIHTLDVPLSGVTGSRVDAVQIERSL